MIDYNQFLNSPSWVRCTPRPRCTRRQSSAGTQLRTDDNCKITDDDSSLMRMIWRTITMITSITMGTFSNTLHLIERTPGLFVPLLVKVVPVVWLNRVFVVRSYVTWVKSSRLECYQRQKKVFWSYANPNSTCSQVSRHLGQVKSFAMLSKKEEGVLVFCKSQHCLG